MMWVKVPGVLLIVSAALLYTLTAIRKLHRIGALYHAWLALLDHMRDQISCFNAPMSEIMQKVPSEVEEMLFEGAKERSIEAAVQASGELPEASRRLLAEWGTEMGKVWQGEQLSRLDHFRAALAKEQAAFHAALPSKRRLLGTLPACGALALLLLVW